MAALLSSLRQLKILLLGDSKTGKHCYVARVIHNKYPNDSWSNKECDISSLKIKTDDDTEVQIQILNIRGAERGKTKLKKYFKNIDGYIIMFDVTAPESYDNVMGWKTNVDNENKSNEIPCILLANKCDLEKDEEVRIQIEGINNYCEALGFSAYFETSSKNNLGIQQSLQHLIRQIIERGSRRQSISFPSPPPSPTNSNVPRPSSPIKQEHTFKIIVIGELNTGKTAIIQRYVKNTFSTHYRSTIGSDLALKKIQYNNDIIINIHIWDIAGDERFGSMTHLFYRDAAGCLIVFDVSKSSSLHGAVKWKDDFDNKVNFDDDNQVPCLLVGNKNDLAKDGIVMSETHMTDFCRTHKFLRWYETSAKDNTNIVETFSFLINDIMNNILDIPGVRTRASSQIIRIDDDDTLIPENTAHTCCNS